MLQERGLDSLKKATPEARPGMELESDTNEKAETQRRKDTDGGVAESKYSELFELSIITLINSILKNLKTETLSMNPSVSLQADR